MKRHSTLIELSRDHHHTLAMAVRILRDPQADHSADIRQHGSDLLVHFTNEEQARHGAGCHGFGIRSTVGKITG